MQRYIHRRLGFAGHEIKEALVRLLQERDYPYPAPSVCDVKFTLTENGATLEWTEDCEMVFSGQLLLSREIENALHAQALPVLRQREAEPFESRRG